MSEWKRHLLRFWGRCDGVAAIEFGLAAPLFILLSVGLLEFGHYLHQADTLEKSLRAGGMYAARSDLAGNPSDFSAQTKQEIENIVKTGDKDGSGALLLGGWAGCSGCLAIGVLNRSVTENGSIVTVDVIELVATVPYEPVVPGALPLIGLNGLQLSFQHEQVHFGG